MSMDRRLKAEELKGKLEADNLPFCDTYDACPIKRCDGYGHARVYHNGRFSDVICQYSQAYKKK